MAFLEVNNLKKSFGKTEILKSISFSLEKGEVLSILGSSGSGKTTLLRCLNFLEFAEDGTIAIDGDVIYDGAVSHLTSDEEIRKKRLHFGLVFQQFNLFPQYTVLENIMLAPTLLKMGTAEEIETKARQLIEKVGLTERAKYYPAQLSGGQQQRVAIARALALNPDILCFDEPTSALDPELTGEVLKVIKSLKDKDCTMIVVTHEIDFAHDVSDKVLFMDDGYIVEQGTPDEVLVHSENERVKTFLHRIHDT